MTDASWWRAWGTPDRIVAVVTIVDGPAASVQARDGRAVTMIALPTETLLDD